MCDFSNHFKPSISQIDKPNSHNHYASQHKTSYLLVFLPPLCQITPRQIKNDITIREDYGTIMLSIPKGYTAKYSNKCLSIAKGFDDYY